MIDVNKECITEFVHERMLTTSHNKEEKSLDSDIFDKIVEGEISNSNKRYPTEKKVSFNSIISFFKRRSNR